MYGVNLNMTGYLPDSDPIECDTFEEVKQAYRDLLKEYLEEGYTWNKWECITYLLARDLKNWLNITMGVLTPPDASEYSLGYAVNIYYNEEKP